MKALTASALIELLQKHIENYGDDKVMIFDDYSTVYKTINARKISVMYGGRFVIECEQED